MTPYDEIAQQLERLGCPTIEARNISKIAINRYRNSRHTPSVYGIHDLNDGHDQAIKDIAAHLRGTAQYARDPLRTDVLRSTRLAADTILTALRRPIPEVTL